MLSRFGKNGYNYLVKAITLVVMMILILIFAVDVVV